MNWRNIRRTYQVSFLLLFVALLVLASYAQRRTFHLEWFLELDPLVGLSSALASRVVYKGLLWGLIIVGVTLVFGRIFCSWICPLGVLNHVMSALPSGRKRRAQMIANEWRPIYQTKYYVLIALLVLSLFGVLQVGLLDPIALTVRSFAVTVFPGLREAGLPLYAAQPVYLGGWLIAILFIVILAANRYIMRLWCRMLCPLGALLGAVGRFSLFRIHKHPDKCLQCHKCTEHCHGACNPHSNIRVSDCVMCLNCIHECPHGGVSYGFLPDPTPEAPAPDLQ